MLVLFAVVWQVLVFIDGGGGGGSGNGVGFATGNGVLAAALGVSCAASFFFPSAALVKATLIASGASLCV